MKRRTFCRNTSLTLLAAGNGPLLAATPVLRFGVCTDLHHDLIPDAGSRLSSFIAEMNRKRPDFVIQLGDFCFPKPANQPLLDTWRQFSGPAYHVIGNHDTDGGFTHAQVVDFWGMKAPFYSFDQKGFHVVVLNGNEKNPAGDRGYPRYIGAAQLEWLEKDLSASRLPAIVCCHQGLDNDEGGIEQAVRVRRILERSGKVRLVLSGHHHQDYLNTINGIPYLQINSMSYFWLGEKYKTRRFSDEIEKKYPYIQYTAPYKEPLWATISLYADGAIQVEGKETAFVGPTPAELGSTEAETVYPARAGISTRKLKTGRI